MDGNKPSRVSNARLQPEINPRGLPVPNSAVVPQGRVQDALNNQQETIAMLEDAFFELARRLDPIVDKTNPIDEMPKQPVTDAANLAARINDNTMRIKLLRTAINMVIDRLEL